MNIEIIPRKVIVITGCGNIEDHCNKFIETLPTDLDYQVIKIDRGLEHETLHYNKLRKIFDERFDGLTILLTNNQTDIGNLRNISVFADQKDLLEYHCYDENNKLVVIRIDDSYVMRTIDKSVSLPNCFYDHVWDSTSDILDFRYHNKKPY